MRLIHRRSIVPPALLLALSTVACSSSDDQQRSDVIRTHFPAQAEQVLNGQRTWLQEAEGYRVDTTASQWKPASLTALVAHHSEEGMLLKAGDELSLRVKELQARGKVSLVDQALSYARTDGSAYWVGLPGGLEEWLLVDRDVKDPNLPVASWEVEGGHLQMEGPQVLISAEPGAPARIAVSAPFAYGPEGQPVKVQLGVDGQHIHIYAEASAGPLLIDPMWLPQVMMLQPQYFHAAGLLSNGNVIVSGGESMQGPTGLRTLFNLPTNSWVALGFGPPRSRLTGTSLTDGSVLFVGGDDGFQAVPTTIQYSAVTSFVQRPSMFEGRANHTATRLNDGRVMVCGGQPGGGVAEVGGSGGFGALDSCEIYDPVGQGWSFASFMTTTRQGHSATTLQDGRVLQCGGLDEFDFYLDYCDIYDPTMPANGWSALPSFGGARAFFTLTTLADGRVLMTGGENFGSALNNAQVFNPATLTWSPAGPMPESRIGHTANLLMNGQVLIAGGFNNMFQSVQTASLFNPTTNTFMATATMMDARAWHTGTTLQNGDVLVSGGLEVNSFNGVASSQVFVNELQIGDPCTMLTAPSCVSGICEDGVCCDVTCTGTCMACSAQAKGGGTDGVCEPVVAGNDPIGECGAAPMCNGDDIDLPDTCDGSGACMDAGVTDCGFFTCTDQNKIPECTTNCAGDTDCAVDGYCDIPNNNCVGKGVLGEPATNPNECLSGFVADGVCCDTACDVGSCDACTVAMGATSDGVCTPVVGECDDNNPCTIDLCLPMGCDTESVLDGTPCPDGQCIAGMCVPDASTGATTTATTTATSGAGGGDPSGGTGAGGEDGNSFNDGTAQLEGSGLCTAAGAGHGSSRSHTGWMVAGLALALGALGIRRRREEEDEQQEG